MQKHVEQSANNPKLFVITYHAERTQADDMYAKLKELGPKLSDITIHAPGEWGIGKEDYAGASGEPPKKIENLLQNVLIY